MIFKKHTQKKERTSLSVTTRFDKKKRRKFNLNNSLSEFLDIAGVDEKPTVFNKRIIKVDIIIMSLLILTIIIFAIIFKTPILRVIVMLFFVATLVSIALYLLSVLAVFSYLDVRIYKRTKQVEEVLPDFLQLTSANISAGMTIDRALWLAVRPRFGVLAKEIEQVAKSTIAGEDLNTALINFSNKYDSRTLKESMNLLIAGLNSGGEIAVLLNKIALNIQETKIMQKEIAASVMTYVIFIGVATILAAPFLFALSAQLLITTKAITSNIQLDESSGATSSLSFDFSSGGISVKDFTNFSILVLIISAIASVAIISVIRKGTVKGGLKLMPVFLAVSLIVYALTRIMFNSVLGSLF